MKREPERSVASAEETIFHNALAYPKEQRAAYLAGACGDNLSLRSRIESLLQAQEAADHFLEEQPQGRTDVMSAIEKPGDFIGRYKLLELIGEGGCGVVYAAEQTEPVRRRVALKIIKLGMDTRSVVARFEAERQALALMDHPNIAKILDAGSTETGRPFFVMELVRGIRITDYCDQNRLTTQERLDLFTQVCHAVQHAHQKGIIHRDIKPSNILVTLHDGVPVPKVIDFGIAKATNQQRLTDNTLYTAFQQFIGTPAYMSPEQAEMSGLDVDTRSDIYSLGVLLYELLTGRTPFDAQALLAAGLDEMRRILRQQEPLRPSTRLATLLQGELTTTAKHHRSEPPQLIHLLRGDLDWIVMKALEKDRTRRYESAAGLAHDVEHHLRHELVSARPPSTAYRVQKFLKRNRLMASAAGTVVMTLVLGLMVSLWQWRRAEDARARESSQRQAAQAAQRIAQEQKREALLSAYASDMNLAFQASRENRRDAMRQRLEAHRPAPGQPDLRGWEWGYLNHALQSDAPRSLPGHQDTVACLTFSPDGRYLATGSNDGTVRVWDLNSQRELAVLEQEGLVVDVLFSPDGRYLLTASNEYPFGPHRIGFWEVGTWKDPANELFHDQRIAALALSWDGRYLAITGDSMGGVVIRELGTKTKVKEFAGGSHVFAPLPAAFHPGAPVLAFSDTNCISLWDLDRRAVSRVIPFAAHSVFGFNMAFSPDGTMLAVGGGSPQVIRLDRDEPPQALTDAPDEVRVVAFSPDGSRLAAARLDSTLTLYDAATWQTLSTIHGPGLAPTDLAFSPDGKRLAGTFGDGLVRLWDTERTADERPRLVVPLNAAFSMGEAVMVMLESNRFEIHTGIPPTEPLRGSLPTPFKDSPAVSPYGRRIVYREPSDTYRVVDVKTGTPLCRLGGPGIGLAVFRAFSPNEELLTGTDTNHHRIVWNAKTGEQLARREFKDVTPWVPQWWLADSRTLMLSLRHGAYLWDFRDNTTRVLNAESSIMAGVMSPDRTRLVTLEWHRGIKVWDLRHLDEPIHTFKIGRGEIPLTGVYALSPFDFSPDGRRLVVVAGLPALTIYDVANWRELGTIDLGFPPMMCRFSQDGHWLLVGAQDLEGGQPGAVYLEAMPL